MHGSVLFGLPGCIVHGSVLHGVRNLFSAWMHCAWQCVAAWMLLAWQCVASGRIYACMIYIVAVGSVLLRAPAQICADSRSFLAVSSSMEAALVSFLPTVDPSLTAETG